PGCGGRGSAARPPELYAWRARPLRPRRRPRSRRRRQRSRAASSAHRPGQSMCRMMVLWAQPENLQRLGGIAVIAVHLGHAANLTRLAHDFAGAHGMGECVICLANFRIGGAPAFISLDPSGLPIGPLVPLAIVVAGGLTQTPVHARAPTDAVTALVE